MFKSLTWRVLAVVVLFVLGLVWTLQRYSAVDPETAFDHNFNFVQRDGVVTFGSQWLPGENGWQLGIDARGRNLSVESVGELTCWPSLLKLDLRGDLSADAERALLTQFEEKPPQTPGSRRFERWAATR